MKRTSRPRRRVSNSIRLTLPVPVAARLWPELKELAGVSPSEETRMLFERVDRALARRSERAK